MKEEKLLEFMKASQLAGLSVGVYEHQWQSFYLGVTGKIPPFNQQQVQAKMVYDLASLTKVLGTTTRMLQLIQADRLSFETRVCEIIQAYPNLSMTIGELLLHHSGLPAEYPDKNNFFEQALISFYSNFVVPAEKKTVYSDLGFMLLGLIIEAIDGTNLAISFEKNIFEPLKMASTGYQPIVENSQIIPTELTTERGLVVGTVHDSKAFKFNRPAGSAGLFSTLADLEKFASALLFNKILTGEPFFSEDIYQELQNFSISGRTWGWERRFNTGVIYHTGFTGPAMGLDLINKRGLILLTNRIHLRREDFSYLSNRVKLFENFFSNKS